MDKIIVLQTMKNLTLIITALLFGLKASFAQSSPSLNKQILSKPEEVAEIIIYHEPSKGTSKADAKELLENIAVRFILTTGTAARPDLGDPYENLRTGQFAFMYLKPFEKNQRIANLPRFIAKYSHSDILRDPESVFIEVRDKYNALRDTEEKRRREQAAKV